MTLTFLSMTAVLLGFVADKDVDRHELIQLIDAAQASNHRDISFDYEGRWNFPNKSGPERIEQVYTGSFVHRIDGATLTDIYDFKPEQKQASHDVVAILDGTTSTSTRRADQKQASIGIKQQGTLEYAGPGNYRQIWLVDWVKKFVVSDYIYEFEGKRQYDGSECIVAKFRLTYPEDKLPKERSPSKIFWIDLNRGGHVVRQESRVPGDNLASVTTVQLQRFEPQPGRIVWLPIAGRVENLVTLSDDRKRRIFVTKPVNYTTYDFLPLTLRFDRGLNDAFFSVKARVGDVVSDQVRKAQYEFGQYMVRPTTAPRTSTDAEVKAELERMLKDSKIMASELKASSPSQEESVWWTNWPWAVAGSALAAVGFVFYRRRRG